MSAGIRKKRVAEQLLSFVAGYLRRMGDPRFEWLTLTDIDMSPDLKTAWIYWSMLSSSKADPSSQASSYPKDSEIHSIEQALIGATPLLKRGVGQELRLRFTPNLVFKYDSSSIKGSRIEQLLREARQGSAKQVEESAGEDE